jgi:hypothetical protein
MLTATDVREVSLFQMNVALVPVESYLTRKPARVYRTIQLHVASDPDDLLCVDRCGIVQPRKYGCILKHCIFPLTYKVLMNDEKRFSIG